MRNNFFYRCVCIVEVLIILIYPFSAASQETSDAAIAVADAKRDVKFPFFWLGGGFLVATGTGCMGGSVVILSQMAQRPLHLVYPRRGLSANRDRIWKFLDQYIWLR